MLKFYQCCAHVKKVLTPTQLCLHADFWFVGRFRFRNYNFDCNYHREISKFWTHAILDRHALIKTDLRNILALTWNFSVEVRLKIDFWKIYFFRNFQFFDSVKNWKSEPKQKENYAVGLTSGLTANRDVIQPYKL